MTPNPPLFKQCKDDYDITGSPSSHVSINETLVGNIPTVHIPLDVNILMRCLTEGSKTFYNPYTD